MTERQWKTIKLALLYSLLAGGAYGLLGGCAAKRPPLAGCVETACGDVCCNNDGKLCPYCPPAGY